MTFPTTERFGFFFDGSDNVNINPMNLNTLYSCSFELFGDGAAAGLPIVIHNGRFNRGYSLRSEANLQTQMRVLGTGSRSNKMSFDVIASLTEELEHDNGLLIDDQSDRGGENSVYDQEFEPYNVNQLVTSIDLTQSSKEQGLLFFVGSTGEPSRSINPTLMTLDEDGVSIPSTALFDEAVVIRVNVENTKQFVFKHSADISTDCGRVIVIGIDDAGNQVDPVINTFLSGGRNFVERNDRFAGCYQNGSDDIRPVAFRIKDPVGVTMKYIYIGLTGGSAAALVTSMRVYTDSIGLPSITSPYGYIKNCLYDAAGEARGATLTTNINIAKSPANFQAGTDLTVMNVGATPNGEVVFYKRGTDVDNTTPVWVEIT